MLLHAGLISGCLFGDNPLTILVARCRNLFALRQHRAAVNAAGITGITGFCTAGFSGISCLDIAGMIVRVHRNRKRCFLDFLCSILIGKIFPASAAAIVSDMAGRHTCRILGWNKCHIMHMCRLMTATRYIILLGEGQFIF